MSFCVYTITIRETWRTISFVGLFCLDEHFTMPLYWWAWLCVLCVCIHDAKQMIFYLLWITFYLRSTSLCQLIFFSPFILIAENSEHVCTNSLNTVTHSNLVVNEINKFIYFNFNSYKFLIASIMCSMESKNNLEHYDSDEFFFFDFLFFFYAVSLVSLATAAFAR